MKHLIRLWAVSGLLVCLSACGGKQDAKSEPSAKPLPVVSNLAAEHNPYADLELKLSGLAPQDQAKIVTDTPDNAVKSWWETYDQMDKFDKIICTISQNVHSKWKATNLEKQLTPDALERIKLTRNCNALTWKRQIDEVKSESETRAVVFTTIWPVKVPPEDANKDELTIAKIGTKVKYVLEKSVGKWVISDILRFTPPTSYSKESWDQMYEGGKGEEYFLGTVYFQ